MAFRLFYSYSHKDEKYKESLETHLSILQRQGLIDGWNDRKIDPGELWKEEIDKQIMSADIVLFLVSANFLASDYCYETEAIFALQQHNKQKCIVIPIIIKPCLWNNSHFSHLQALPKDAKPITTWKNRDLAWVDVAKGIVKVIEKYETAYQEDLAKRSDLKEMGDPFETFPSDTHYLHEGPRLTIQAQGARNPIGFIIWLFLSQFNEFYVSPLEIFREVSKNKKLLNKIHNWDLASIQQELAYMHVMEKVTMIHNKDGNRAYKLKSF